MPGQLGPDYGQLYGQIMPYAEWQQTGGIPGVSVDPNYTAAAMQLGYIPNPFAPAGTEGQAQMRFLATLKNIMDQQLGGPNGRAAQISPDNPIAGGPGAMSQYLMAAAALMQSPQGRMLLPGSQAAMFQNGYNWNPINATDQSGLQQLLASARARNPGTTVTEVQGGNANNGGTAQPALPPGSQAPANAAAQANTGKTSSQVSGFPGDVGNQGPNGTVSTSATGGAPIPGASNQTNIANALAANDQGGVGNAQYGPASPPPPLVAAWNSYLNSRQAASQDAQSHELDFWTNPVFQGFANWVQGALGQPGYSVR